MSRSSYGCDDEESVDIEEMLDNFIIRKRGEDVQNENPRGKSKSGPKIYASIPLMLCDIQRLVNDGDCFKAFGSVPFRTCILHATVIGRGCHNDAYHKYMIDDGTATLELNIFRDRNKMEALSRMQDEVNAFEHFSMAQNRQELCSSLRRLLTKTKEQLDHSNIPLGTKLLIHGRPSFYRGVVGVDSYSVCGDALTNRDVEIAFKDNLISWYTGRYPKLGVKF